jgi:hypothetical protein
MPSPASNVSSRERMPSDQNTYFRSLLQSFLILLAVAGGACSKFGNFWDDPTKSSVTPSNTVVAPVYAPAAGSYNATQNVSISSSTSGATICYTTDGVTIPTCDSTATCTTGTTFSTAISVPATQTLMALACKATMDNSTVASAPYIIDSTPPTTTFTAPAASTTVTNTQVTYNNTTEACGTASITWTQTGGTADGASPHVQALTGSELTIGAHAAVTLTNNPTLVSGAIYTLAYNCSDAAGNAATPVSITNVTFDNTPPVISAVGPTNGTFVNTTNVSYTLSEVCSTATITWTQTGGTADGASPHAQALSAAEKTTGAHNNITLASAPALVSGAIYSIAFDCTDAAGLVATTVTQTSITYDNTVPAIAGVQPAANAFVNTTQVSYTFTENCASGSVTWAQVGGTADVGAPHVQALTGGELSSGPHSNITITNNPTLVSGAIYDITVNCTDAASNVATPVSRTNVTFDNTNIVISAVAPASNDFVNSTKISYTLSETCASGSITWTRTGGNADGASPHVQALTAGEMTTGAHTAITLGSPPTLVDGTIYTVTFNCTDAAANAATPIVVTNVTYDITVPAISAVAPASNAFVNNTQVTYTFSELCNTATITWTRVSGAADGTSPHVQALTGGELAAGAHTAITITNNPTLVSGAAYDISFACTDAAANVAPAANSTNVMFDNTPPTVTIQNMRNNTILHTNKVLGTGADNIGLTLVEFNLDSTTWNSAAGTTPWNFPLPTGTNTWRDRSTHNIQVRASDAAGNVSTVVSINVKKGNNKDVNGDGYEDIFISAFKYVSFQGKVHIFHGTATGIVQTLAAAADRVITGESGAPATATSRFGRNAAMADFNGDGFGDIAISATAYNTNQGAVYIFNGTGSGITQTTAATANKIITGTGTESFSATLFAADINADGYADLLSGANAASANLGAVYLFYGGAGGITQTASNSAPVTKFQGEAATTAQFGSSIIAGDFDNDGFSDVAIGAPVFNTDQGRAYMFYGTAGGFAPGTYTAALANAIGTGTSLTFLGGSMSAGDLNGDGATDFTTGGYGSATSVSKLIVYYGATGSRPFVNNSAPIATTILEGTLGYYLSTAISSEDVNVDGYADIIVGGHGGTGNNGYAKIFYGQASQISVTTSASAGLTVMGEFTGHQFGRGVGSADVDGDGYPELIVGANFFLTPTSTGDAGRAYVFQGSPAGPSITSAAAATRIISGATGSEFGVALSR